MGRLDEAKGAPFLMRAWDGFRARRPRSPLRLVVVGGGEMADAVASWATATPVRDDGWSRPPHGGVPNSWPASRAVVVPSQWEETFGMVAVEAMAAGTAPVASAHGAFPELVTPDLTVRCFHPRMSMLSSTSSPRSTTTRSGGTSTAARAHQTYRSRFSPDAGVARLLEIYRFAVEHPIERSGRSSESPVRIRRTSPRVTT